MAHITHLNAVSRIKLLLKRKDHNHLADIFFDLVHASCPPGPYLRADKVEDRNAQAMQLARQPQVEIREIDQDGCIGLALCGFRHQMLESAANVRQVPDHLHQSDYGNLIRVDEQFGAGSTHLLSAHAEESRTRRKVAQSFNELRAVGVT